MRRMLPCRVGLQRSAPRDRPALQARAGSATPRVVDSPGEALRTGTSAAPGPRCPPKREDVNDQWKKAMQALPWPLKNTMPQGQGHIAKRGFAPEGALQSVGNADFFGLEYEPFGALLPGRNYSSDAYRFGMNGQEKDDEIFGSTGTSYTAQFWQYDSRTGRRWNLDPVIKPWSSGYSTFSNSPISRVDPNGDDDFFDVTGKLIRHVDNGTNNIYMWGPTKAAFSLLSDVEITEQNKKAVAGIVQHYALKAGITDAKHGLASGIAGPIPGTPSLAYYDEATTRIRVTVKDGHISKQLNDAFNLQNVLYHEFLHHLRYTNKQKEPNGDFDHLFVYLGQVGHETFAKSTRDHQIQTLGKVALYAHKAMMDGNMSVLETNPILQALNAQLEGQGSDLRMQTQLDDETGELKWFVKDGDGNQYMPDTTGKVD